ncbi:MAG: hypothetical protein PHP31_07575 [Lentimicrobiaceae bacterium]|nr:hypothetical protein [Lentimicrobiaceae bacterium]
MKKDKIFLIIISLAVVAVVVYFFVKKKKTQTTNNTNTTNNPTKPPVAITDPGWIPATFPLTKGMQGQLVIDLQTMLNTQHGAKLVVDGKFGEKTYQAVINARIGYPVGVFQLMNLPTINA